MEFKYFVVEQSEYAGFMEASLMVFRFLSLLTCRNSKAFHHIGTIRMR